MKINSNKFSIDAILMIRLTKDKTPIRIRLNNGAVHDGIIYRSDHKHIQLEANDGTIKNIWNQDILSLEVL